MLGNIFMNCGFVVSYSGGFGPAAQMVSNNLSLNSRQPTAYGGILAGALADINNAWDKPSVAGRQPVDSGVTHGAFGDARAPSAGCSLAPNRRAVGRAC